MAAGARSIPFPWLAGRCARTGFANALHPRDGRSLGRRFAVLLGVLALVRRLGTGNTNVQGG